VLAEALQQQGLPQEILTDRAGIFFGPSLAHRGLTVYQLALECLGIKASFARPYKARTKGKVEKLIRDSKGEFTTEPFEPKE